MGQSGGCHGQSEPSRDEERDRGKEAAGSRGGIQGITAAQIGWLARKRSRGQLPRLRSDQRHPTASDRKRQEEGITNNKAVNHDSPPAHFGRRFHLSRVEGALTFFEDFRR